MKSAILSGQVAAFIVIMGFKSLQTTQLFSHGNKNKYREIISLALNYYVTYHVTSRIAQLKLSM